MLNAVWCTFYWTVTCMLCILVCGTVVLGAIWAGAELWFLFRGLRPGDWTSLQGRCQECGRLGCSLRGALHKYHQGRDEIDRWVCKDCALADQLKKAVA